MRWYRTIGTILTVAVLGALIANAQTKGTGSVVMQPRVLSPREYLLGDTSRVTDPTSIPGTTTGGYSEYQDSAYKQALALNVAARARFIHTTRSLSGALSAAQTLERPPTPWENMQRNLAVPREMLAPSPQQIAAYKLNIQQSQYVPGVLMFPMGSGNLQVSFGDIGKFLGLMEDVSPRIKYLVDETTEVTIVVYNASALKVATIYNGIQPMGVYEIVWNGRDDNNHPVPPGDYVSEVSLGNQRIMRKRILITR